MTTSVYRVTNYLKIQSGKNWWHNGSTADSVKGTDSLKHPNVTEFPW